MAETPNFCDNCGAELTQNRNRCESCGRTIAFAAADTVPAQKMGSAACPVCGRTGMTAVDVIARYKAIPDKENPTVEEEDSEIKRAEVIDLLAKPEKPESVAFFRWILYLFIPVVNVISVFLSPLVKGLKIFMILPTLVFIGFVLWYATGTFEDPFAAQGKAYMVGFAWIVLYIICLLYSKLASKRTYASRLAAYELAVQQWQHLCYCEACDKVFFNNMPGKSAPVADTRSFLASS